MNLTVDNPSVHTLALVGSYVPRQCGIGTFTKDLRDAIQNEQGGQRTLVMAMDDIPQSYPYPSDVRFQIRANHRGDYRTAAELLNINMIDIVIVQHEYGIYGGQDGHYVLNLMRNLRMPIITTLHTVLLDASPGQTRVLQELAKLSDRLVVMSEKAVAILTEHHRVPREKIALIPHGIPDVHFVDSAFYKDQFALEGRTVLLTFGLLSPGKGIEVAIEALPKIVQNHPNVTYVILGATHPHVLKVEGNAYRRHLELLAERLGVRQHVVFHNRFVSLDELCGYIGAADIYITPYLNKQQITSGTLAYAMGAGKAVVSTPFIYAEEMLAGNRGCLVPFQDPARLGDAVCELLDNDLQRNTMRKKAYMSCRNMVWQEVARNYLRLAEDIIKERRDHPKPSFFFQATAPELDDAPEISLAHLRAMTDDTGILQHAVCAIPDRNFGYCTDDNARALIAALMYYDMYKDDTALTLAQSYQSFLYHAFDPESRRFHNFMSFDRRWLEEERSDDVQGRAIWALGVATALAPNDAMLSFATRLFAQATEDIANLTTPRAWSFALVGIHAYLRRFGGDTHVRRIRLELAGRLYNLFKDRAAPEWPWCEDVVTYDNGKLPHALILSGQWLPHDDMLRQGIKSLEWLLRIQTTEAGVISLIGNQGWFERSGVRARFDQQPVEVMALVEACAEAYRATHNPIWRQRVRDCFSWFLGNNDTKSVLCDYHTGGCRDGLHAFGPNLNEGAESTLSWLISQVTVNDLSRQELLAETSPVMSPTDPAPKLTAQAV